MWWPQTKAVSELKCRHSHEANCNESDFSILFFFFWFHQRQNKNKAHNKYPSKMINFTMTIQIELK